MVQPNLTKFIDDDGGFIHAWMVQQLGQKRGLAASQEPGDDGDGCCRFGLRHAGALSGYSSMITGTL